jgi:hypothetical protein
MLKAILGLTMVTAVMAASLPALAFTLTNLDGTEHVLTIVVEDDEWDVTIRPNETLSHLCRSGCSIAIGYGEERDFKGNETVVITGGRLIFGEKPAKEVGTLGWHDASTPASSDIGRMTPENVAVSNAMQTQRALARTKSHNDPSVRI